MMDIDFKEYQLSSELRGHEDDVRGICVCDNVGIATSSRDRTVRFWSLDPSDKRKYHSSKILLGHTSFVGPLAWISPNAEFPEGGLVSGGMDTMVLVWDLRSGEKVQTLQGHKLQVTGVTLDNEDIVSSSVDSTLKRWRKGKLVEFWEAHNAPIQTVIRIPSGEIVSGSSDTTIKLWKGKKCAQTFVGHTDGVCVQSLEHPGCVWDAKFLENGDIVTACSDGVTRIWTVHSDKVADSLELEAYASELSQYKLSRKKVGGLKLYDLPGLEALQIPGTSAGQTKVVREGDNGVAYSWDMKEQRWDKLGEVVDGPDDGMNRPILDGIQYDYVFDVDIGDGEPTRKLPYNRSDNPYDAADKWLLKENLPFSYRQQIVEFILQNTGQKDFTLNTSFRDPYTGASAYVPGQPSSMSAIPAKPTFKHIPKKGMLIFDAAQFDGILKKIMEFNNALLSDLEKKNLSMSELETSRVAAVVKILKDTSHYHCSSFADVDISLLLKLLKTWPPAMIFPVIDILRMTILHPDGASLLLKHVENQNDVLMEMIEKVSSNPTLPANLLTGIRAVTNLFKNSSWYSWLQKHRSEILDAFSSCYSSPNKNVQLSYSTLILNYAVLLIEKKDEEGQSHVLSAALEIAEEESMEVDSKYRALVAIGTLMLEGLVKKIALDFDVGNIARVAKASKETKIAEVGADIELLAKQS
ncbi:phospholipase A-2-activating protein isoform X3 [Citrus clementina]|uniref:phospholipase A-2-activating protein isoform X3 n=1 Tax=Citrus clementina TaxID=85681 RepID=UPI000CECF8D5|nr:phospholipase A-2-activating protein isoform X3 [Citrus x clementina]